MERVLEQVLVRAAGLFITFLALSLTLFTPFFLMFPFLTRGGFGLGASRSVMAFRPVPLPITSVWIFNVRSFMDRCPHVSGFGLAIDASCDRSSNCDGDGDVAVAISLAAAVDSASRGEDSTECVAASVDAAGRDGDSNSSPIGASDAGDGGHGDGDGGNKAGGCRGGGPRWPGPKIFKPCNLKLPSLGWVPIVTGIAYLIVFGIASLPKLLEP